MFWNKKKTVQEEESCNKLEELYNEAYEAEPYDDVDLRKWAAISDFPVLVARLGVQFDCGPIESVFKPKFSIPDGIMFVCTELSSDQIAKIVMEKYTAMIQTNVPEKVQRPIEFSIWVRHSGVDMRSNTEKQVMHMLTTSCGATEKDGGLEFTYDRIDV